MSTGGQLCALKAAQEYIEKAMIQLEAVRKNSTSAELIHAATWAWNELDDMTVHLDLDVGFAELLDKRPITS